MKLFFYVGEHDTGHASNPYFGFCMLCLCKYRKSHKKPKNVVALAKPGDWVIGTGGANKRRSAGDGKLVYAMRVDKKLEREGYYVNPRFAKKKPVKSDTYDQQRGDNKRPRNSFERHVQFVLISRHFYYFGANAVDIPKKEFPHLEKKGPGFRYDLDRAYVVRFVRWLETETGYQPGIHGMPWMKHGRDMKWEANQGCKLPC